MNSSVHTLVLAAGKGKRMKSRLPKVLHPVLFQPVLSHVLNVAERLEPASKWIVVGHEAQQIRKACQAYSGWGFVEQLEQNGTGHAVQMARKNLESLEGTLMVLSGDSPLIRPESLRTLVENHQAKGCAATVVTAKLDRPDGYGRILRSETNTLQAIREDRDCNESERKIQEINSGIYCFEIATLFPALDKITNQNAQGEWYLTDVIETLLQEGKKVAPHFIEDAQEVLGVNDRADLVAAEKVLQWRINRHWLSEGVTIQDPNTVLIDARSSLTNDVFVGRGSTLVNTRVEEGSRIDPYCYLEGASIAEDVHLKQGTVVFDSEIQSRSVVGPYAHLRPESKLGPDVKIGNFVEVKKSSFGEGSKASHLSYIGDAEIGRSVNLGCGFVTCNYDGKKKSKTIIGDGVFVGSDSQTVAPVELGEGSYIASGSTITKDVPANSLALSRSKQINKEDYAKKYQKEG